MSDTDQDAQLGRNLREHSELERRLKDLDAKAKEMKRDIKKALRLITGETTGEVKDGKLIVANSPGHIMVSACNWPTLEEIGQLVEDRQKTEQQLQEASKQIKDVGMGRYVR